MIPRTSGTAPSPLYIIGDEIDTGCFRLDKIAHIEVDKNVQDSLHEGNGKVWCMDIGFVGKDSDSDLTYEFKSESDLRREFERLTARWKEWIDYEYSMKAEQ